MKLFYKKNGIYSFQKDANNFINFCPERGGLITHWISDSKSVLYFDETRFLDKTKSIRGGIPILFPICGSLNSINSIFGENYINMNQHGFARDFSWNYIFNKRKNSLRLKLNDDKNTQKYYPFSFKVFIDVILEKNSLTFEINISNKSELIMPINFGLHPYFNISAFHNIEFLGLSRNCQNQKTNTIEKTSDNLQKISSGIDILTYSSGTCSIKDYGLKRQIKLINPSPLDICVIWSNPPRNMICMEPWTSPRDSLKNGIRKIEIPPFSSQKLITSININNID